jgi:hypothetical protein
MASRGASVTTTGGVPDTASKRAIVVGDTLRDAGTGTWEAVGPIGEAMVDEAEAPSSSPWTCWTPDAVVPTLT